MVGTSKNCGRVGLVPRGNATDMPSQVSLGMSVRQRHSRLSSSRDCSTVPLHTQYGLPIHARFTHNVTRGTPYLVR